MGISPKGKTAVSFDVLTDKVNKLSFFRPCYIYPIFEKEKEIELLQTGLKNFFCNILNFKIRLSYLIFLDINDSM